MSTYERLARSLLLYAARSAPPSLAPRLAEEWLADLEARPAGLPRLRLALGCWWATQIIAREHRALGAVAATTGAAVVVAPDANPHSPSSRRAMALALIACLHVGLIWALASGLLHRVADSPLPRVQLEFLPAPPHEPLPPPPDPTLRHTAIEVPPIVDFLPPPGGDDEGIRVTTVSQPTPPPVATQVVSRVAGGPGRGFPATDDFYPPNAIRAEEKGSVTVKVCVDEAGRLTQTPVVDESSGSARLDAGALRLARAGSGHYRPSTEDGHPVQACFPLRIRFQLRE